MKHQDYYSVLEIPRDATIGEIKNAYRKLAVKWHPDKNLENKSEAEQIFHEISEAYTVLTDPDLKSKYDELGNISVDEESKDMKDFDSKEVFDSFFGECNPFANAGFHDIPDFQSKMTKKQSDKQKKGDDTKVDLICTLEEINEGCVKSVRVTRKRRSVSNSESFLDESKVLHVQIFPGCIDGTIIRMANEGDEGEDFRPGDLLFVVSEKKHDLFERRGCNLLYYANITLLEALTDCEIKVPTISGRNILVAIPEIIHSKYERKIEHEGIPDHNNRNRRGDLIVKFEIQFPKVLSLHAKNQLKNILA